ncbi:LamG domain-containing protein [Planctomycetota bacterium]
MNDRNILALRIMVFFIVGIATTICGAGEDIIGDWELTITELNRSFIIKISKTSKGTLAATSMDTPLDKITFDSNTLRFEGGSPLYIFEGTIKEDGLTIEGELQQGDQQWPALLMRVEQDPIKTEGQVDSQAGQTSEEKRRDRKRLVAWWKLDEADGNDVADSSGNNCIGKLIGNPQWQPAGGKVSGALEFDGDGDYIEIGNKSAFDIANAITVATWIKVDSFDKRWQAIVTKGDTAWRIQRTAAEDTLAFKCTGIESTGSRHGIEGYRSVNDGKWHHAVGIYDGSTVSLYIDGVLDNSCEASGSIQMNDAPVFIGANSEVSDREWSGLIDEVCIFACAMDANAVNELYSGADPTMIAYTARVVASAQDAASRDKLVAWWKLDNDANDSAGVNHGNIHGDPAFEAGKFGQAISLDGDDYVDCGNASELNFGTGDWTLSAWIKTTQTGTNENDEQMNRGAIFANGGDELGGIRHSLVLNETILGRATLTTDDDTAKVQATARTVVNDGIWHHIVGMRNAGQLRIFVDGKLDGTSLIPTGYDLSGTAQHNIYIGVITDNRNNSLYKHFVGLIDEVCVFTCALDANSVSALYSGKDPMTVAEQAKAVNEPPSRPRQAIDDDTAKKIAGDWDATLKELNRSFVITISRNADGSLTANAFSEGPDGELTTLTFDEVTFANGRLRLQAVSIQAIFEGTIKDDGLTIEGQWQQQEQVLTLILKRVAQVQETEQTSQEQSQDRISGKSNIAITLILILVLAGVVAVVVVFIVKSSIRR